MAHVQYLSVVIIQWLEALSFQKIIYRLMVTNGDAAGKDKLGVWG